MCEPKRLLLQDLDEEEEKKEVEAANDEWNKKVNIHNLRLLI